MLRSKNTNALFTLFTIAIPKDPPHTGFGDSLENVYPWANFRNWAILELFPQSRLRKQLSSHTFYDQAKEKTRVHRTIL